MSDIIISSIEDDESISLIISKTLQKQGYQVFSYFTGESFLDDVMKNKPNVILLDLMLPGIQGKEVLKEIKKHPELDDSHISVCHYHAAVRRARMDCHMDNPARRALRIAG